MNYGKRYCLVCGKEFTALYAAQVACSQKCRKLRGAELTRQAKRRLAAGRYSDLDWLNQRLEMALARNRELERGAGEDGRVKDNQEEPEPVKPPRKAENGACADKKPPVKVAAEAPQKGQEKGRYRHVCVVCGQPFRSGFREHDYCSDDCLQASMMHSLDDCPL